MVHFQNEWFTRISKRIPRPLREKDVRGGGGQAIFGIILPYRIRALIWMISAMMWICLKISDRFLGWPQKFTCTYYLGICKSIMNNLIHSVSCTSYNIMYIFIILLYLYKFTITKYHLYSWWIDTTWYPVLLSIYMRNRILVETNVV